MAGAKRNIKVCLWTHVEVTRKTFDCFVVFILPLLVAIVTCCAMGHRHAIELRLGA